MTKQSRQSSRKLGSNPRRRIQSLPGFESLEGRALMAYSPALDPSFGTGGILGSAASGLVDSMAVAVQGDGKIVAIDAGTTSSTILQVRRFNPDGSIDAAFGAAGVANIPLPTSPDVVGSQGGSAGGTKNLAIGADGSISFAASLSYTRSSDNFRVAGGLVARLTATGQLDLGFGTGGAILLPTSGDAPSSVALDSNNNLLVLGIDAIGRTAGAPNRDNLFVSRYTPAGVLDTTFAETGRLELGPQFAATGSINVDFGQTAGIAVAPSGQIVVAGYASNNFSLSPPVGFAGIASINPDGTLDASFGTNGTTKIQTNLGTGPGSLAIQADGDILLAGPSNANSTGYLTRILPDGTTDATFGARATLSRGLGYMISGATKVVVGPDGTITLGTTRSTGNVYASPALLVLARYAADGTPVASFGNRGQYTVPLGNQAVTGQNNSARFGDLALTTDGNVLVLGFPNANYRGTGTSLGVLAEVRPVAVTAPDNDYDGDGKSDVAAYLTGPAVYAIRPSAGGADVLTPFGQPGIGASSPAPGDYNGSGYTEMAVYTPSTGYFYYRPTAGGPDVAIAFGSAGVGNSIPATADYDGDGITDLAVYLPQYAGYAVRPSGGAAPYFAQIGVAGAGQSVPAPGDYDGDGKADLAVYLPQYGILAYRPSSGGADVLTSFGAAGARASIPAPGDYDGDGKTDIAAYLPQYALYAYRPSSGGADVLRSFGAAGVGNSIPAPGDYDGDGSTDLAVYLPQYAVFAYRPSSAIVLSSDVLTSFGTPGPGATVPTASISYAQPPSVSSSSLAATAGPDVPLALTDDVLAELAGLAAKKRRI